MKGDFLEISNNLVAADRIGALQAGGTIFVTLAAAANGDDEFFTGCTLRMTSGAASGEISTITAYNGATKVATLSPGSSVATGGGDLYVIDCPVEARRITKYVDHRGAALGTGVATSMQLANTASNIQGDYNNLYIRITGGAAAGDVRLIQSYTVVGTVKTATPFTPFSAVVAAGDTYEITSGITLAFTRSLAVNDYLLLAFEYDNAVPYSYIGSLVSQQESTCYELELLNLVLPNKTLDASEGGRIAFYPYVYVQLQMIGTAAKSARRSLYSNNPVSANMTFRAAIDDIANPVNSSFIKIDGDGTVRTIDFKPNCAALLFSVHLPNGDIYNTVVEEQFSPNRPNILGQISALFSFKRL